MKDYWDMRLRLEELLSKAEECVILTEMLRASYDERIQKEEEAAAND